MNYEFFSFFSFFFDFAVKSETTNSKYLTFSDTVNLLGIEPLLLAVMNQADFRRSVFADHADDRVGRRV